MPTDIKLDASGDITIPTTAVTGVKLVIQRCKIVLNRWRGDWIIDSRVGIPYLGWLDDAVPNPIEIEDFLRAELEAVQGVIRASVSAEQVDEQVQITVDLRISQDAAPANVRLVYTPLADEAAVVRVISNAGVF